MTTFLETSQSRFRLLAADEASAKSLSAFKNGDDVTVMGTTSTIKANGAYDVNFYSVYSGCAGNQ